MFCLAEPGTKAVLTVSIFVSASLSQLGRTWLPGGYDWDPTKSLFLFYVFLTIYLVFFTIPATRRYRFVI